MASLFIVCFVQVVLALAYSLLWFIPTHLFGMVAIVIVKLDWSRKEVGKQRENSKSKES